jgi:hypothetical protein
MQMAEKKRKKIPAEAESSDQLTQLREEV